MTTKTTMIEYATGMAQASADGMKTAAVGFALAVANGYLPKDHPFKIDLATARKELKAGLKAMNEHTAAGISAVFPRLASKLVKRHGKPGAVASGERNFWDVLSQEPEQACALVLADMRADGCEMTWAGIRAYVGFKPAKKSDAATAFVKTLAGLVKRINGENENTAVTIADFSPESKQAIAGAIAALNTLLQVSDVSEDLEDFADLAEAA